MLVLSFKKEPHASIVKAVRFVVLLAALQHHHEKQSEPMCALLTQRGDFSESHISGTLWHIVFLLHVRRKLPSLGCPPFLRTRHDTKRDLKLHMCEVLSHTIQSLG